MNHYSRYLSHWLLRTKGVLLDEKNIRVHAALLNEDDQELLAAWERGEHMTSIAFRFGLHLSTVYRRLDSIGRRIYAAEITGGHTI